MAGQKTKLHVISHTHWDREWYIPFQCFRMMLVDNLDRLLDLLDRDKSFAAFHLDGQTVPLEDYLEIRPQSRERLEKHIRSKRLIIGPFYLLNDMALVSAEAVVRNLLLGQAICKDFRVAPMKVGYVADQFGHIGQIPQILRGFGIDCAIMGRGITLDGLEGKSEFWWQSPDGSRVMAHHMAGWYNNAQLIPEDPAEAAQYLKERGERAAQFSTIAHLAMMNGCDHLFADEHLGKTLPAVNRIWEETGVPFEAVHSTLPKYMQALRSATKKQLGDELKVMHGELREQRQGTLLSGTLSTHTELKQLNEQAQCLLERYAEPLETVGWLLGGCYDSDFLWRAWRYVLQCHPHDSICGCSINQVHKEMVSRFEQGSQIADFLAERGMQHLAGAVEPKGFKDRSLGLLLFNPGPEREEALRVKVELPEDDVSFDIFQVIGPGGKRIDYQVNAQRREVIRILKAHHLPQGTGGRKLELTLAPQSLPAGGYAMLEVRPVDPGQRAGIGAPPADSSPDRSDWICREPGSLENEHLLVQVRTDAKVDVIHKATGRAYTGMNLLEDGGEAGHSYDYRQPERDEVITSAGAAGQLAIVDNGPLSATLRASLVMEIPKSATADNRARSAERVGLPIVSEITLRRGSRRVEIVTTVTNAARDHRLRALFPTDVNAEFSDAESAFQVVRRPIKRPPEEVFWNGNIPQRSFTDVSDGSHGLAVLNKGLPEAFVLDDPRRTIAITLFRATLAVFREPDLQWGGSAQAQGTFRLEYAVYPHKGDWRQGEVKQEAMSYCEGVRTIVCPPAGEGAQLPRRMSIVRSSDPLFVLSAMKRAERRDEVVLRFVNMRDEAIAPTVTLAVEPVKARLLRMDESAGEALKVTRGKLRLKAGAHEIVTVGLRIPRMPRAGGKTGYTFPFSLWR